MDQFAKDYAEDYARRQRSNMAVRWTVRSKEVHTSKAIWIGEKPKDGGESMVLEALRWAKENQTAGKMTINLGTGGSVSNLEFEQTEATPSPVAEFDAE
jgi:hypothetical protein